MTWTAPMTAVSGSVFTAAQFNTHVRDNLNETAVAKASLSGTLFVGAGLNALVERIPTEAFSSTSDTTTGTAYGDLSASSGPSVVVDTGSKAIVVVSADLTCGTTGQSARTSYEVSGASTVAANDQWAVRNLAQAVTNNLQNSMVSMQTALTPGSNTFTMKYRTSGASTSTFANRRILVIPL
jgi:hypothetical protein